MRDLLDLPVLGELEHHRHPLLRGKLIDGGPHPAASIAADHLIEQPTDRDAITCTNHYRSPELARPKPPRKFRTGERLDTLTGLAAGDHTFVFSDVTAALHAVRTVPASELASVTPMPGVRPTKD